MNSATFRGNSGSPRNTNICMPKWGSLRPPSENWQASWQENWPSTLRRPSTPRMWPNTFQGSKTYWPMRFPGASNPISTSSCRRCFPPSPKQSCHLVARTTSARCSPPRHTGRRRDVEVGLLKEDSAALPEDFVLRFRKVAKSSLITHRAIPRNLDYTKRHCTQEILRCV